MVRTYKHKEKTWTEATVNLAVNSVITKKKTLREAAKHYNLSYGLLHGRVQEKRGLIKMKKRGRKHCLPDEVEKYIASSLRKMCRCGFGPSLREMREIVADFLMIKNVKTTFKDGKPGYEWTHSFLKRHKLTMRKGGQMQIARKNAPLIPLSSIASMSSLKKKAPD